MIGENALQLILSGSFKSFQVKIQQQKSINVFKENIISKKYDLKGFKNKENIYNLQEIVYKFINLK